MVAVSPGKWHEFSVPPKASPLFDSPSEVEYRGAIYPGEHIAIVDEPVWQEINAELRAGPRQRPTASKFSIENPIGSITLWHVEQTESRLRGVLRLLGRQFLVSCFSKSRKRRRAGRARRRIRLA